MAEDPQYQVRKSEIETSEKEAEWKGKIGKKKGTYRLSSSRAPRHCDSPVPTCAKTVRSLPVVLMNLQFKWCCCDDDSRVAILKTGRGWTLDETRRLERNSDGRQGDEEMMWEEKHCCCRADRRERRHTLINDRFHRVVFQNFCQC